MTSLASIVGIAILENARQNHSKTVVLDSQIYLGDNAPPLTAALRYFNSFNLTFDPDEPGRYFIFAHIARMERGADILLPQDSVETDYDIVGDIVSLIPLSEDVDPRHPPVVHLAGVAAKIDMKNGTFEMEISQWVSALREIRPTEGITQAGGSLFVSCSFPDTPRYKQRKPVPKKGTYVAIEGFLRNIVKKEDEFPEKFLIEVETIAFCGQATVSPKTEAPAQSNSMPLQKRKRHFKFSFDTLNAMPGQASHSQDDSPLPVKRHKLHDKELNSTVDNNIDTCSLPDNGREDC